MTPIIKTPKAILHLGLLALLGGMLNAADYYCDPVNGSMSNPGTSASPWSTLEAVFAANKTFASGDVIHLRTGQHGYPTISGANSGDVTIQAADGQTPILEKITATATASHWVISGLTISPEAAGTIDNSRLVDFPIGTSYMTMQDCLLYSASDTASWTKTDWTNKAASGIRSYGANTTLRRNVLRNVGGGISIQPPAVNSLVSDNLIENFCYDGIVGLADNTTFEYNTVRNSYNLIDSYHRDGFQSYSYDVYPGGTAGYGVVSNVTLRGNVFISQTDPNQPFSTEDGDNMHGIGCFDGMFDNWIVENNLIVNGSAPGIVFLGARNCRVVNNTVIRNPLKPTSSYPKIEISAHKGDSGPYSNVYSSDNVVRNNIMGATKFWHATNTTVDHNIVTTLYDTGYFADYAGFDFRPQAGSPLIDAGSATQAPTTDIIGTPRPLGSGHDIGAYEYGMLFSDDFEGYTGGANIGGQSVGSTTWVTYGTGSGGSATVSTAQSYGGGTKALYLSQTATGFRPRAKLDLIAGGFISSALSSGSVSFAVLEDPANGSGTNYYTVNIGGITLSRDATSGGTGKFYFSVAGGNGTTIYFSGSGYTYTAGAWNLIEVAFDNASKSAALYINGGLAGTITGASADFTVSAFTLGLYSSSVVSDKVYFDALEVNL